MIEVNLAALHKVREQIVQYKGYCYKKAIGRAYHSHWICVKSPCIGRIKISELKGGSIKVMQEHDQCSGTK